MSFLTALLSVSTASRTVLVLEAANEVSSQIHSDVAATGAALESCKLASLGR
jgi:hypothetical protein